MNTHETLNLKDVKAKLAGTRNSVKNVPYELHDLTEYMSKVANNEFHPIGMLMCLVTCISDIQESKPSLNVEFPEGLLKKRAYILSYLNHFPLIIDEIAEEKFAIEFRGLFEEVMKIKAVKKKDNNIGKIYRCDEIRKGIFSIVRKNKAELLMRLYNNSHPHGMGILHYEQKDMDLEEAEKLLENQTYFDYLKGRVMKIDLSGTELYVGGYNLDNGKGAAERIIAMCEDIIE